MNFRPIRVLLMFLFVWCLALVSNAPLSGQDKDKDKEKNSIKALFHGIPADLRSKVRENPVRCDRVNDWLKEHVNGKGKAIEIRLGVDDISTLRSPKDGTYLVRLSLAPAKGNVLEDEWRVSFSDQVSAGAPKGRTRYNFSFEGVSTAEAEKLVDLKQVVIQGKVQEAKLARSGTSDFGGGFGGRPGGEPSVGLITIALEDVRVDGKKWTPYISPVGKKKGGGLLNSQKREKGNRRHETGFSDHPPPTLHPNQRRPRPSRTYFTFLLLPSNRSRMNDKRRRLA